MAITIIIIILSCHHHNDDNDNGNDGDDDSMTIPHPTNPLMAITRLKATPFHCNTINLKQCMFPMIGVLNTYSELKYIIYMNGVQYNLEQHVYTMIRCNKLKYISI